MVRADRSVAIRIESGRRSGSPEVSPVPVSAARDAVREWFALTVRLPSGSSPEAVRQHLGTSGWSNPSDPWMTATVGGAETPPV